MFFFICTCNFLNMQFTCKQECTCSMLNLLNLNFTIHNYDRWIDYVSRARYISIQLFQCCNERTFEVLKNWCLMASLFSSSSVHLSIAVHGKYFVSFSSQIFCGQYPQRTKTKRETWRENFSLSTKYGFWQHCTLSVSKDPRNPRYEQKGKPGLTDF